MTVPFAMAIEAASDRSAVAGGGASPAASLGRRQRLHQPRQDILLHGQLLRQCGQPCPMVGRLSVQ